MLRVRAFIFVSFAAGWVGCVPSSDPTGAMPDVEVGTAPALPTSPSTDAAPGDDGGPDTGAAQDVPDSRDASTGDAGLDGAPRDSAAEPVEDEPECVERTLGQAVVDHACLHGVGGPFEAALPAADAAFAPDASRPHTAFELSWPEAVDRGYLRYDASASGLHAFFVDAASSVTVTDAATGAVAATVWTQPAPCASLPHATVVFLDQGTSYLVMLGQWATPPSLLVAEPLVPFGPGAFSRGCECQAVQERCDTDLDCCTNYCQDGLCEPVIVPGCGDTAPDGAECAADEECCSGSCVDSVCTAEVSCRSSGPCVQDSDCCQFCHDGDHCH